MKNVHSHQHALLRTLPRVAAFLGAAMVMQSVVNAQTYVTIGSTNGSNSTTSYPTPFGDYYESHKAQYLFRGSELSASGMSAGTITEIQWYVTSLGSAGNHERFTLYAGTTGSTQLGNNSFLATPTQQFGPTDYYPTSGLNSFTLASPIVWNGSDNILVQICHGSENAYIGWWNNPNTSTNNARVEWQTGLSFRGSVSTRVDNNNTLCATSTYNGTQTTRPRIRFGYCTGAAPGVAPASNGPVCVGNTLNLFGTLSSGSATNFNWSGPGGFSSSVQNPSISNVSLAALGEYIYTAKTGVNGCSSTGSVIVAVNPSPGISSSASAPTVCEGGSVVLTATLTRPAYSAGGSSGSLGIAIPDNSTTRASNSISVVGGSGNISANNTISVGVNITHTWDADVQIFLVGPANCGTLELSTSNGGNGDNYTGTIFQTGAATGITSGSAPFTGTFAPEGPLVGTPNTGIYTLPAGDLNGCPVNGSYTLRVFDRANLDTGTLQDWDITIDGTGVATASFSGPGTVGSVSYSGPNNTTATATVSNIPAGVHSYVATATTGVGCTATANVGVTAIAPPNAGTNGTLTACETSTTDNLFVALMGLPETGGTWSGPSAVIGGNYNASTMTPGVYTYTVTPNSPCIGNATATVTVTEQAVPYAGMNGTITVCASSTNADLFLALTGSPTAGGTWSGPSAVIGNNYDASTMTPGIYTYSVAATAPCTIAATAAVTVTENALPVMACLPNSTVCILTPAYALAESTPLLGAYSGTGISAGNFDPSAAGVGTHTITYSFTDANICTNTCTFQITVDGDVDNDGVCDLDDSCIMTPGQIGSACPAIPGFTIGSLQSDGMGDCVCVGATCTTDLSLDVTQGNLGTSPAWELRDATNNTLVQTGGGTPWTNPGVHSDLTCVPDGKFKLIVTGLPVGASYILRLADPPFTRLIDNSVAAVAGNNQIVEFTTSPTVLSSNGAVQVPMGQAELLYTSCDKYFWQAGEYLVVNEDPDVAAEWVPNGSSAVQSGTTGYDFWFYDPNGTFSFVRQRRHNVSDNFGNVGSSRTCHMKVNNWAVGSHIPDLLPLNVRVRAVVNNVPENWGPACRFQRNEALGDCAPTLLFDVPGHFAYSCDVFRDFTTSAADRLYARPIAGATKYRFTFTNAELVTPIVREVPTYYLTLGWGTPVAPQLQPGQNYSVTVEAYKGGVYCQAGRSCLVNINNAVQGGQQNNAIDAVSEQDPELALWPNPNQGELLNFKLTRIGDHVSTVSFDLYDLSGKRLVQRTIAVSNGQVNTVIDLHGELAAGMYVVNITSGGEVFTDRVVIQP
ncbi:MAG: T9SS type A sorting domain-containing protein [Flavobacteriales bacterium]|nr:T9SS type A sorting domain-containing protein [Flavobacteriales bacterium]